MCNCIEKVNEALAAQHLKLKQVPTVSLKTGKYGEALALETVSLKRGVRPKPINIHFCPFCGEDFEAPKAAEAKPVEVVKEGEA